MENYIDTSKFGNIWLSFRPPAAEWMKAWKANNMAHNMVSNWKFRHVGVAVRDMDKVVEYYQSLGIATIGPEQISERGSDLMENGKPTDPRRKLKIRMVQVGTITYEMIQQLEGESVHNEFLDSKGEGISHIAFTVDDFDKERIKLVEKGASVILGRKDQHGFAYFNTRKVGNIIIELVQQQ